MALIETNFIRPQEVYDRNTGESKVRYRSYDGNDRFIPVVEGENGVPKTLVEVTHAELKAMRDAGKLTPGALYRITDYNCTTTQENTQSAGHQFDIVLLALSENKLAEEGWAMMHDNIYDVTFADGVTKKCWIYKTPDFDNIVDINTLLGTQDISLLEDANINEETKTIIITNEQYTSSYLSVEDIPYNYFQNSNLSAWKVWYCLDNDTARFAWADDSVDESSPATIEIILSGGGTGDIETYTRDESLDVVKSDTQYYGWTAQGITPNNIYTTTETPAQEDNLFTLNKKGTMTSYSGDITSYTPVHEGTGLPNGRGVIYRLIDEWGNDIKYDFKNIQFKRKLTNGQYNANGDETWCYTLNVWYDDMCQDASVIGNTLSNDDNCINGVYNNKFGYASACEFLIGSHTLAFVLGNNVILSFTDSGYYYGIYSNIIGDGFHSNTIGNSFNSNIIGNAFCGNIIGNEFNSNIIGNGFFDKTIEDNISYKNYGNEGVELATKS